uniref:Uncharacterized protein n=1 Tax=Culex tarsalis TaxID=7177 RepID=A0A1Q3FMH7_CULTA
MSSYGAGYATTGRTGSTNSVYDYPEHLNPFYEDENHKRLRFWHFGGHRSDKPKSERRGSLVSIRDGLRDMWEFKTFRVKKKRSSSLGVTKTSESPPPLRRDDAEAHYNTISNASAYRATISHTQSNTTTPMFERNTRYRSSLQDQQRENGIGLFRNDRYRSTIQNGFATYGGSGGGHHTMVTSTPRSRYNAAPVARGMTAGVSQTSLKSTNPFDDEDALDDSVSLGGLSTNGTIRQSMTRARKKRRAPPPPPRMVNMSSESTSNTSQLSTRLRIDETPPLEEDPKDVQELTNLTAEIESFVRTTSDDNVNVSSATNHETSSSSSDANNNRVTNLVIVEEKEEVVTSTTNEGATKPQEVLSVTVTSSELPQPVEEISQVEELKIVEEPPPLPSPRSKPTPPPVPQTPPLVEELDMENLALPETPIPARRLNKNRNQPVKQNGNGVLRITESSDSVTTTTPEEEQNMDSKAIKPVNYEFEYKVEPIKTEIDAKIGSARLKISESTSDVNIPPNDGTERRRSVRDIIESINKSQSLLKVNQDSTGTLYSAQSSDSVHRNMRELNEREREIARLLREMGSNLDDEPVPVSQPTKKRGSYYDNVPEGGDENLDNLLSKSDLRVKKSPTKSLGIEQGDDAANFQDCIDWNPLPKPRRSRHFADPAVNQPSNGGAAVLTAAVDRNGNNQS